VPLKPVLEVVAGATFDPGERALGAWAIDGGLAPEAAIELRRRSRRLADGESVTVAGSSSSCI